MDDKDNLKKLEAEEEFRFLDVRYKADEVTDISNPYFFLYHGVRMDSEHELFESILSDREIKCANKIGFYRGFDSDNCNEGKYISLIHYSGDDYDIEFKTFIEENVSFIISPKLNPLKCKYLPFDEWEKIKKKLPKTKHRYSYAREEYQYPDSISLDYVVGVLYPLRFYSHKNGYMSAEEDLEYVKKLLIKYGFKDLPILDPTKGFEVLDVKPTINFAVKRNMF